MSQVLTYFYIHMSIHNVVVWVVEVVGAVEVVQVVEVVEVVWVVEVV